MLIQNDQTLAIFLCLQAKLRLFKNIERCYSAQAVEKFFGSLTCEKLAFFRFCNFTMLAAKAGKKHSLKQTEQKELKGVKQLLPIVRIYAYA